MTDDRQFLYTGNGDEQLFNGYGIPTLNQDQYAVARETTTMKVIGKGLSTDIDDTREQIFHPATNTMMTCNELTEYMGALRSATPEATKSLFFPIFKPLINFPDNGVRVACCIVKDLGTADITQQLVPTDQPPSLKTTQDEIRKAYATFRSKVPSNGAEFTPGVPFDDYVLRVQNQVNVLARSYRKNKYAKQRDPVLDHFTSFDKAQNYSDQLLDKLESDEGLDVGGMLRDKLYEHTSFLTDIPFIGEILGEAIDITADTVGSFTNIITDTIGEGLKEVDWLIRPALNVIPGVQQAADYVSYGLMQIPNALDTSTGDMLQSIRLNI